MLLEHVSTRNSDAGELDPTIVNTISAHLFTNIANVDTRQQVVGLGVSQRDDKALGAVLFALDNQLSKDRGVGSRVSSTTDPPLIDACVSET